MHIGWVLPRAKRGENPACKKACKTLQADTQEIAGTADGPHSCVQSVYEIHHHQDGGCAAHGIGAGRHGFCDARRAKCDGKPEGKRLGEGDSVSPQPSKFVNIGVNLLLLRVHCADSELFCDGLLSLENSREPIGGECGG